MEAPPEFQLDIGHTPRKARNNSTIQSCRSKGFGGQTTCWPSLPTTEQKCCKLARLYRFEQGRTALRPGAPDTSTVVRGFVTDTVNGMQRQSVFGASDGRRAAWIRYPERRTTILLLTTDDAADAKVLAQRIAERLFRSEDGAVPCKGSSMPRRKSQD